MCALGVGQEGILPGMIKDRYSSYSKGVGKKIRDGKVSPPASPCVSAVNVFPY